jgi:hypothetical protein
MVSRITYFIRILAVFVIFGQTFLLSGLEKLGPVPDWFQQTFGDTFLATFPGLQLAWLTLGVLEMAVVIILLISLIRLEFMPDRGKDFLKLALMVAALTFAALAFGQHLVGEFGGAANLFFYFGATMATLLVIDRDHDAALLHQRKG